MKYFNNENNNILKNTIEDSSRRQNPFNGLIVSKFNGVVTKIFLKNNKMYMKTKQTLNRQGSSEQKEQMLEQ